MESKNLIIAFIWTFVLVSVLVISWEGYSMEFVGYMMFFVIALLSTIAVEAMIPRTKQAGSELERELREMRARLNALDEKSS
jgi:cobalamin biosynthesis protein CobD/CbiB